MFNDVVLRPLYRLCRTPSMSGVQLVSVSHQKLAARDGVHSYLGVLCFCLLNRAALLGSL